MSTRSIEPSPPPATASETAAQQPVSHITPPASEPVVPAREVGGRGGLDPTRFGDWEKGGRCIDF